MTGPNMKYAAYLHVPLMLLFKGTTRSHFPSTGTRTVVLLHQTTIPQLHPNGDHVKQLKE